MGDGGGTSPYGRDAGALGGSPIADGGTADAGTPVVARPSDDEDDPAPLPVCGQATKRAEAALTSYCGSCHGASSAGQGGFKTVTDVDALIASGKVIPKDPKSSPLYKRLAGGTMPPQNVTKRPTDTDVEAVADWIECGAPDWTDTAAAAYEFVSIDSRLQTILADLRSEPNVSSRRNLRYLDLSTLANAGYSKEQIEVYRQAVSFMMNSLSRGRTAIAPQPIDDDELIFRIDLGDYLWTAEAWRTVEAIYPYGVVYDQDSRLFPFDETSAAQIRRETGTQLPVLQADWFLSHVSRPPLYHTLLNIPATLGELEAQLGLDIDRNIQTEDVQRAGFKLSGPSQNHRVIERHELSGNRGALWLSYDFANNLNQRNVFANPLDFQEDGGELIFNLDNGLQAYMVTDANGRRLDKAPNNVVQDPLSRDGAVENGLSCMTCHQEDGQLPKDDEIRAFVLSTSASARETEAVLALYPEREVLSDAFEDDANRYRAARAALGITKLTSSTLHTLDDTHQGVLDINAVASVIGVEVSDLERALSATPQAFPAEIVALRSKGGGIQRDAFEDVVGDLVEALGLGAQLRVSTRSSQTGTSSRDAGTPTSGTTRR